LTAAPVAAHDPAGEVNKRASLEKPCSLPEDPSEPV